MEVEIIILHASIMTGSNLRLVHASPHQMHVRYYEAAGAIVL